MPILPNPAGISCATISLPAGWNLISGVRANDFAARHIGPLYTYRAGDTGYRVMTLPYGLWSLTDYEAGYWMYLQAPTLVRGACQLPPGAPSVNLPQPISFTVNAGWTLMSAPLNGFFVDHSVEGADEVLMFDTTANQYVETDTLQAGFGAWVYSATGALITLVPLSAPSS
jgi:hypothetical protein